MQDIIIHVDMDAFYAAVEMRDNPDLRGKPLIIGSLPNERGVVATCNYAARKYGIHSAMNIKRAYSLCPHGVYMHPNFKKYKEISLHLYSIFKDYSNKIETIALDEAYLDVTETTKDFLEARKIAKLIKDRIKNELGLSCSIGLAYSKTAAKVASEEKKPGGYFEIFSDNDFVDLIIDREVRVLYTVGQRTAEKLKNIGIYKVRDLFSKKNEVIKLLGKHGDMLIKMASGKDGRKVTPHNPQDAKSISREITFQKDVSDYSLLNDILFLLAVCVEKRAKFYGLYGGGVNIKITYSNMKSITRARVTQNCEYAFEIYQEGVRLLNCVAKNPVRLVGLGLYNLSDGEGRQLSFRDILENRSENNLKFSKEKLIELGGKYNIDFENNLSKIYNTETLHRVIEYMRGHKIS